ncbi:hypothetical protein IQ244_29585 [Nostoc sp. LEGE 06077]|uniref:hypothetical protein n=1 Tax=Nostoc sp. LEGE 06077 TaxID=915325 RepID=UPI001881AD7B|nr:hypothetical protein [Nostoc sp. LEGE 06077]MBE9210581.1 hypothetical protein [Nostoc sp. LEGE 06077]
MGIKNEKNSRNQSQKIPKNCQIVSQKSKVLTKDVKIKTDNDKLKKLIEWIYQQSQACQKIP